MQRGGIFASHSWVFTFKACYIIPLALLQHKPCTVFKCSLFFYNIITLKSIIFNLKSEYNILFVNKRIIKVRDIFIYLLALFFYFQRLSCICSFNFIFKQKNEISTKTYKINLSWQFKIFSVRKKKKAYGQLAYLDKQ